MLEITHVSLHTIAYSYLWPEERVMNHKVNEWQIENCKEILKITKHLTWNFKRKFENKIP